MGHNHQECMIVHLSLKESLKEDYPFSLALKPESSMVRECLRLGISNQRQWKQCSYEGDDESKRGLMVESALVSIALIPVELEFQKTKERV